MFLGFTSSDASAKPAQHGNQQSKPKDNNTAADGSLYNSLWSTIYGKSVADEHASDKRRTSGMDEVKSVIDHAPITSDDPHHRKDKSADQQAANSSYLNFNFYDMLSKTAQIPNLVIGGKSKDDKSAESQHIQISNEELDAMKDEESMQHILDHLRNTYIERKLVGSINVSSTFATFSNSTSISVNGAKLHDEALALAAERKQIHDKWLEAELHFLEKEGVKRSEVDLPPEEEVKLPKIRMGVMQSIAVMAIARILNALELRSMAYRNKSYAADITLTAGIEVSISAFMATALSFSISCSATCESLRRYVDNKKAVAKEQREQKLKAAEEKKLPVKQQPPRNEVHGLKSKQDDDRENSNADTAQLLHSSTAIS